MKGHFSISKINLKNSLKKIKQHPINIKNYTAHPHDMVHVPAKFGGNTVMYSAKTKRDTDEQTDGRTDGGHLNISRAFGAAGDTNICLNGKLTCT